MHNSHQIVKYSRSTANMLFQNILDSSMVHIKIVDGLCPNVLKQCP